MLAVVVDVGVETLAVENVVEVAHQHFIDCVAHADREPDGG